MSFEQYKADVTAKLQRSGRIVTGWWGSEPIHRAATPEDGLGVAGIKQTTLDLALRLLENKDYKPTYKI